MLRFQLGLSLIPSSLLARCVNNIFNRLPLIGCPLSPSTILRLLQLSTNLRLLCVQDYSSHSHLAFRRNIQRLIQHKPSRDLTHATRVHFIPRCFVQIHNDHFRSDE